MAQFKSALEEKMAKAKDRTQKGTLAKGPGNQLSLRQASAQQGIQTPITPLGGATLNLNKDQTKMIGTQEQKQAALGDTLGQAQRSQQGRTTLTGEEQEKKEMSQQLQSLEGLGEQINNLIQGNLNQITQTDPSTQLQVGDGQTLSQGQTLLQDALNLPTNDPNRDNLLQDAIRQIANEGGGLNLQDIMALLPDPAEAISQVVAAGLSDQIFIDDPVLLSDLGFQSVEELGQNIGLEIPPGTSLQQFQEMVSQQVNQEMSQAETLRNQMQDPNLSPQERSAARQALIDMGALGLSQDEARAHEVEKAVSEADQITFGGETHKMEDLLNDEYISSLVKRALEDPESELAKNLAENSPDFYNFITSNAEALKSLADEVQDTGLAVEEAHEAQQELASLPGGLDLPTDLINQLWGVDLSQYGVSTKNLTNSPIYKMLTSEKLPDEDRAQWVSNLSMLARKSPGFAKALTKMSEKDLKRFPKTLTQYTSYLANPKNSPSPGHSLIFKRIKNPKDLMGAGKEAKDLNILLSLGYKGEANLFNDPGLRNTAQRMSKLSPATQDILALGKPLDKNVLESINVPDLIQLQTIPALKNVVNSILDKSRQTEFSPLQDEALSLIKNFSLPEVTLPPGIQPGDMQPGATNLGLDIDVEQYRNQHKAALDAWNTQKTSLERLRDQLKSVERKYGFPLTSSQQATLQKISTALLNLRSKKPKSVIPLQ